MGKNINPTHNLYGHISELMLLWKRFSFRCAISLSYGMYKIVQFT